MTKTKRKNETSMPSKPNLPIGKKTLPYTTMMRGSRVKKKDDVLKITKNGKAYYATDPDARWTVKGGKPYYGYKVHINSDESPICG